MNQALHDAFVCQLAFILHAGFSKCNVIDVQRSFQRYSLKVVYFLSPVEPAWLILGVGAPRVIAALVTPANGFRVFK